MLEFIPKGHIHIMITLGVFGSRDMVDKIYEVAIENGYFKPIKFYWTPEIGSDGEYLRNKEREIDLWLFSGLVSYSIITKQVSLSKPTFYIEYTGSSIHQTLLKASYTNNLKINDLSFDSISVSDLTNILREVNIQDKPISIKPFNENLELEDYINFHQNEFQKKHVRGVVTCIPQIVSKLQTLKIPTFQVLPTKSAINNKLNTLMLNFELEKSQKAQIAVQIIEFDLENKIPKNLYFADEFLNLEMKITTNLLKYAKKLNGSLKNGGMGRFLIFTTKGIFEELTDEFENIPDIDLDGIDIQNITCGIGVGFSVYEAELNAINALIHANETKKGTWMALLNDGRLIGPLNTKDKRIYSVNNQKWQKISDETSLNIITISKVANFVEVHNKNEFTVKELSNFLQILPRSTQRIITALEQFGYVRVLRTESPHSRGRPKKIYEITF